MKSNTRVSRWRALGSAALGLATVAVIGVSTITPAKADWDRWHHHHSGVAFGFSVGAPGYAYDPYYAYPAYPAYGYSYGYPYYYGPAYYGPSFSIGIGTH